MHLYCSCCCFCCCCCCCFICYCYCYCCCCAVVVFAVAATAPALLKLIISPLPISHYQFSYCFSYCNHTFCCNLPCHSYCLPSIFFLHCSSGWCCCPTYCSIAGTGTASTLLLQLYCSSVCIHQSIRGSPSAAPNFLSSVSASNISQWYLGSCRMIRESYTTNNPSQFVWLFSIYLKYTHVLCITCQFTYTCLRQSRQ